MKFRTQFPIEQLSGHDGYPTGLVAFRSNGIDVFRRFVIPANPETVDQEGARAVLTAVSQNFKTLTDAQRATWATWAQAVPVAVLGKSITLQEMAVYVQSDFFSYLKAATHLTDAPSGVPGFAASDLATFAYATGTTILSFDVSHNWTSGTDYWIVRITDTLASAQRNPRPTDWRLADGFAGTSIVQVTSSPQTIQITTPKFTWANNDWMGVSVQALSGEYALGSEYWEKDQITVT